jgi:hypothetical protein
MDLAEKRTNEARKQADAAMLAAASKVTDLESDLVCWCVGVCMYGWLSGCVYVWMVEWWNEHMDMTLILS